MGNASEDSLMQTFDENGANLKSSVKRHSGSESENADSKETDRNHEVKTEVAQNGTIISHDKHDNSKVEMEVGNNPLKYPQSKEKMKTKKKVHFTDDFNDAESDHSGDGDVAVHLHSFTLGRKHHNSWESQQRDGDDSHLKKIDGKITEKHRQYAEEEATLVHKLEEANVQFDSEKYETGQQQKCQDYLSQLDQVKMPEQFTGTSNRMEDLDHLEAKLKSRQEHFYQYEKELEDFESYLKRRQDLCNRREEDLRRHTEELDTIHKEIEADKFNLQGLGFDASNIGSNQSRSLVTRLNAAMTSEKEDYILKANLRKCQRKLTELEEENEKLIACNKSLTNELQDEREISKKNCQKLKHLETQLTIYISQSKQGGDHLSMRSLQSKSLDGDAKLHTNRGHASVERYLAGQLTLNQEAELRHKLRNGSSKDNTASKQKYIQRKTSLDSGGFSSLATIEAVPHQNANGNMKSSICSIL